MNLTPTELERLTIFTAAEIARRNLRAGIALSHPEAIAFLTDEIMVAARRDMSIPEIRDMVVNLLDADQVMDGVAEMVRHIAVDAAFEEGTKLVTVEDPIATAEHGLVPGEIIVADQPIEMFAGVEATTLTVVNNGDRDVQVRSQTHFFEVNAALEFDREAAWGRKLAVTAGAGVRFEPGIPVTVRLVRMGGDRVIQGFSGTSNGRLDDRRTAAAGATP